MSELGQILFKQVIDHNNSGIIITENLASDWAICYVNKSFCEITGYDETEVIGKNPRFLQGKDEDQAALKDLHKALNQKTSCVVTLRNYTKDGEAFWNRLTVRPLHSETGEITHYVGSMENLGSISENDLARTQRKANRVVSQRDQQTGIYKQEYFETQYLRDWNIWLREEREISLAIFTPDNFNIYTKTFGPAAAESALRRIAYIINTTLKRASDTVARYQDNSIISLMLGNFTDENQHYLNNIADKVLDLSIHHPHSPDEKFLSVSLTTVAIKPNVKLEPVDVINFLLEKHERHFASSNTRQFINFSDKSTKK